MDYCYGVEKKLSIDLYRIPRFELIINLKIQYQSMPIICIFSVILIYSRLLCITEI